MFHQVFQKIKLARFLLRHGVDRVLLILFLFSFSYRFNSKELICVVNLYNDMVYKLTSMKLALM